MSIVPKQKPQMDAPKVSGRALGVVHDARDMLTKHYKEQASQRQPGGRGEETSAEYAANRLKEKAQKAKDTAVDTGGRAVRNYRVLSKADKGKQARRMGGERQKAELKKERATRQLDRSPHSVKTRGAATGAKSGSANHVNKMQPRAARVKTASAMKRRAGKQAGGAIKQQAAKAAKAAAQAARKVGQLILKAAKALARGIIAVAGACAPLLIIIIVAVIIGAVIASPFGLFFSGEDDNGSGRIQQTVLQLCGEFNENVQSIITGNAYDELRLTYTSRGYARNDNLIDVLAVYAVKVANPDTGMDVVTFDDARIAELRAVFWDMVVTTYEIKNEPKPDPDTGEDVDYFVLYLNVEAKGAQEMASLYSFGSWQREILENMLSGEFDANFSELIGPARLFGGVGDGGGVIGTGNFVWPSSSSNYVTSPFGPRTHPITGEYDDHYGIDISAGENSSVLASDGGTVTTAGWHYSYGNYIIIDHGNGFTTLYAHNNTLLVAAGETVTQGQQIALVGSTGSSKGFHIHFEVKYNGTRVDPLQFFDNYTVGWL